MWVNSVLLIKLFFICASFVRNAMCNVNDYEITCKDEKGENVDWFYVYKLPGHYSASAAERGCLYFFITPSSVGSQWLLSEHTLNDTESIAGRTLTQAYFNENQLEDRVLVAYNDEPPNAKGNSKKGHLKGVVVADKRSGFWLVHSVPLYPNITSNANDYHYPTTGMIYGQSFLCLSLSADQIDIVGKQLIFNEPQIYESKLPQSLLNAYPNIQRLIDGKRISNGPYWNDADLTTLGGSRFKSFAKSSKFYKELYEDWIAPTLNTNLFVETWRKGSGNFPSNCTKSTRVWNVSKIKFNQRVLFPSTDDHSKFAVSDDKSNWICVGDINRAEMQTKRGGGSVCYNSKPISESYRTLVADFEPCQA
ncbi:deoxyribonuclease-2-alpha-like [Contarinia nasturtii]|uniref:deoxyribonuclease-2-alpha-like n=1 Tax=Contarinia nasturtii TaxID=265458 RepID=UPI0012D4AB87|nr:deoxyribonuclease-2-alpha-like [Contarinia nasturtii]